MGKSYTELIKLETFKERFEYLQLNGSLYEETFGSERYLNQMFYNTPEWKMVRNQVIYRDLGCDLGIEGMDIFGKVIVHHINPISKQDILDRSSSLFDSENLICVSMDTHNALHYGNIEYVKTKEPVERKPDDTKLW